MDDEDIPKISGDQAGEACAVVLAFISILVAYSSLGAYTADPFWGFAIFSIPIGLAAITIAILTVGRKISK